MVTEYSVWCKSIASFYTYITQYICSLPLFIHAQENRVLCALETIFIYEIIISSFNICLMFDAYYWKSNKGANNRI